MNFAVVSVTALNFKLVALSTVVLVSSLELVPFVVNVISVEKLPYDVLPFVV